MGGRQTDRVRVSGGTINLDHLRKRLPRIQRQLTSLDALHVCATHTHTKSLLVAYVVSCQCLPVKRCGLYAVTSESLTISWVYHVTVSSQGQYLGATKTGSRLSAGYICPQCPGWINHGFSNGTGNPVCRTTLSTAHNMVSHDNQLLPFRWC